MGARRHASGRPLAPVTKGLPARHTRLELALIFLGLLYLIGVGGLVLLYSNTRCPGGTLTLCQMQKAGTCGSSTLTSVGECSAFVKTEACFCEECKFCLQDFHRIHCAKSEQEKLEECTTELTQTSQLS